MTTGQWVLLIAVVGAVTFGLWRAATDGRFRGTHPVRGAGPEKDAEKGSADMGGTQMSGTEMGSTEVSGTGTHEGVDMGAAEQKDAVNAAESVVIGTPYADLLGERATFLQFSSAFCAPCRATRRVLEEVVAVVPGVAHVEVDAESQLELVRRLNVMRTPTTLVLDAAGREVTRATGAPTKQQVLGAVALIDGPSSD